MSLCSTKRSILAIFVYLATLSAVSADVLFVVSNAGSPTAGDASVRTELVALGYTVELADDNAVTASDASGRELIVISGTISSGLVGNMFNQVAVPLLTYEPYLYDNLGLTATSLNQDYGVQAAQTSLSITGSSQLTAGLSGNVTVSSSSTFSWGDPNSSAIVAATISGNSSRAAIFGYDTGAALVGGSTAPARRVGFHVWENTGSAWNSTGRNLFGAAVSWATSTSNPTNQPPVVDAGADTGGFVAIPIALNGDVSDDGIALPLTVAWSPVTGATFTNPSDPDTTVTFSAPGQYTLTLVADDTQFNVNDTVEVTVQQSQSSGADILFVVSNAGSPVPADVSVWSELLLLNYNVELVGHASVTTNDATGKDLIIVSESVHSSLIKNMFNTVAVPVVVSEPYLFDNMGMTLASANTDFGFESLQTIINVSGSSPLTAGLSGAVVVSTQPTNFSWGVPGSSAIVAATLNGNSSRAAIFAYESGAVIADGSTTSARRVGFYLGSNSAQFWNTMSRSLFAQAVAWAINGSPTVVVKLLALGDSITHGTSGFWSYRRELTSKLDADTCSYDMVGSEFGPEDGTVGSGDFDRDHEGHRGFRTDEILSGLPGWMSQYQPDWILLHIGTNDVIQGVSPSIAAANITSIIQQIRIVNPSAGILMAQIIPNFPTNESVVNSLNSEIFTVASSTTTAQSPVIVVDQYSGYDTFVNNFDQVHPNLSGELLVSDNWYAELQNHILASCSP